MRGIGWKRYAVISAVNGFWYSRMQDTKRHISEIARMQAAKEQAEAAQAQLRKELAVEMERVKTEYLFKVRRPLCVFCTRTRLMLVISSNTN